MDVYIWYQPGSQNVLPQEDTIAPSLSGSDRATDVTSLGRLTRGLPMSWKTARSKLGQILGVIPEGDEEAPVVATRYASVIRGSLPEDFIP